MDGGTELHVGHVESPGAAGLALLLMLLAFCAAVMAVRGTYLTVWEAIRPGGGGSSSSTSSSSSSSGGAPQSMYGIKVPTDNPTRM